jgi:methylthioribose-1-phosphate isomerase
MQQGLVDMVITGTDRTTYNGDVANKIGTYLKALAAHDNRCPFYVALPSSTFDWEIEDGVRGIPIEQRDPDEVRWVTGVRTDGEVDRVLIAPPSSPVANFAFDVTPSRLVTGLITERGVCKASKEAILALYPEKREPGC